MFEFCNMQKLNWKMFLKTFSAAVYCRHLFV